MTKSTCPCGATIETESAEHLTVWAREHAGHAAQRPITARPLAPLQPSTQPYFVPFVPHPPLQRPPELPHHEIWCGDSAGPDLVWVKGLGPLQQTEYRPGIDPFRAPGVTTTSGH